MNNSCTQCGLPIPIGQNVCSMCYGDIGYGKDGYYEEWAREQERQARIQEEEQRQQVEQEHGQNRNSS